MQNTELSVQPQQAIRNFELLEARVDRFRETQAMVDKYGYEVLGLSHTEVKTLEKQALERFTTQYGKHYDGAGKNLVASLILPHTVFIVVP